MTSAKFIGAGFTFIIASAVISGVIFGLSGVVLGSLAAIMIMAKLNDYRR